VENVIVEGGFRIIYSEVKVLDLEGRLPGSDTKEL
jgi:hypothetical protein